MNQDEQIIQSALLDKPLTTTDDIWSLIFNILHTFFGFVAVCLMAGILYALITHEPKKPVPDCGSCRIYKNKEVKK